MQDNIAHITYDGKIIETLYAHLDATAYLCRKYGEKIGIGTICELSGFAHDLGKASQAFQTYIRACNGMLEERRMPANKEKSDHSTMGAQILHREMEKEDLAKYISLSIMSHHTGLLDCIPFEGGKGNYQSRIKKDIAYESTYQRIDEDILCRLYDLVHGGTITEEYAYIESRLPIQVSDKRGKWFQRGLLEKYIFSCLCDADRNSTAAFMEMRQQPKEGRTISWKSLIDDLEKYIMSFSTEGRINIIRGQISQCCLGHACVSNGRIMQLSVPTGGGKTLSALRFALAHAENNDMDKIFYIVPYTSIIEQNAHVAREIFETGRSLGDVVLECHSNLSQETDNEKTRILSENWNAPIVFTTMVQFLESIFDSRISRTRRMHTMANSILIFDEIQCLPKKCIYLFNEFVRFITEVGKSTVVLCTATQPLLDNVPEDKMGIDRSLHIKEENKIIRDDSLLFSELRRTIVHDNRKQGGWSDDEISRFAEDLEENNILIIVNTKKSAESLFDILSSKSDVTCYYLSTNMCSVHRGDTLRKIKAHLSSQSFGKNKMICISTQLIEAGVDIDFECVIRFMSGLDSIAQAAGRCNRNGRKRIGNVYIVDPKKESLQNLEDIKIGADVTTQLLEEYKEDPHSLGNDLLSPTAIARYFDILYFKLNNYNSNYFEYEISKVDRTLFELLSQNMREVKSYRQCNPQEDVNFVLTQSYMAAGKLFQAIDSASQGVIVQYGEGEDIVLHLMQEKDTATISALLKRAQRYSINIHPHLFERLRGSCIFEVQEGLNIYYLEKESYDNQKGLVKGGLKTLVY